MAGVVVDGSRVLYLLSQQQQRRTAHGRVHQGLRLHVLLLEEQELLHHLLGPHPAQRVLAAVPNLAPALR